MARMTAALQPLSSEKAHCFTCQRTIWRIVPCLSPTTTIGAAGLHERATIITQGGPK